MERWGSFKFSLVTSENCTEVCFWTSGRRKLCIVFCHSCEIYRIWTSRSKEERCRENALKSSTGEGRGEGTASHKRVVPYIGKGEYHYVILLY